MIVDHDYLIQAMAQVLRERREHLHLAQSDLAKLSGLHRSYIGDYERRGRNISVENLHRLALALDTTPSRVIATAEKIIGFRAPSTKLPKKASSKKAKQKLTITIATGLLLLKRRETLQLTQTEVAKRSGVKRPHIEAFENGTRKISLEDLSRVALALDMNASKVIALAERKVKLSRSK